ncbi:hypothetical protein JCM8097_009297 [Rhodosporidiobolus ruineniae]
MSDFDPSTLDFNATIALQDVSTAIITPYMLGLTFEVLFIGIFLALFTSYVQTDFHQHSRRVRAVMWVVFVLVLGCLGMAMEEITGTGISQDRSAELLLVGPAQSNVLPILTAATSSVCQGFLMVRAASLMNNRTCRYLFGTLTSALILLSVVGAALFSADGFLASAGNAYAPLEFTTAIAIWLFGGAAADLSISIAFAWTLRSKIAGFNSNTDSILKRLIIVALRTAAYTSVISLAGASVATAVSWSNFNWRTIAAGNAFWLPLPALHGISLYTTLSTRRVVNERLGGGGAQTRAFAANADDAEKGRRTPGGTSSSSRSIRLGPLGKLASTGSAVSKKSGSGGGGGGGTRSADHGVASMTGRSSAGGVGEGSMRAPLQIQVQEEEEVRYEDDADDFDEDLGRRSTRSGRSRGTALDFA